MIAIIDYGVGNLRSVQKAFEKVGADAQVTSDREVIRKSSKVVLPGVGAIRPAMDKLHELGLIDVIKEAAADDKPFLGICVGFQLLFDSSTEGGQVPALGILPGTVERFQSLKVPHMGWNQLKIIQKDCPLMKGIADGADVYFCHSYYVKPKDQSVALTRTDYGVEYVTSIARKNLFGVQFHHEKSQTVGLKVLENFAKLKI